MVNLIETAWVQLKIAFDVQDPLQTSDTNFEMPENLRELNPTLKRRLTICNLFANLGQSIDQIVDYLHVSRSDVVSVLIDEGLMKEQRKRAPKAFRRGRRQTDQTHAAADSLPVLGELMNRAG